MCKSVCVSKDMQTNTLLGDPPPPEKYVCRSRVLDRVSRGKTCSFEDPIMEVCGLKFIVGPWLSAAQPPALITIDCLVPTSKFQV